MESGRWQAQIADLCQLIKSFYEIAILKVNNNYFRIHHKIKVKYKIQLYQSIYYLL